MKRRGPCLLLLGLSLAVVGGAEKKDNDAPEMSRAEKTLLALTNEERAKEKLPALVPNAKLLRMARAHAANMAKQQKMEHVLDGKSPADRAKAVNYRYARVGENIAWSDGGTLKEIMKGWMNSPGHRANILEKEYCEIGLGVAENDKGETYYAQVFGKRLNGK